MRLFFNGQQIEVVQGTTLRQLAMNQNSTDRSYTVNNSIPISADTALEPLSVVDENTGGLFVACNSDSELVEVTLSDFTGKSGVEEVSKFAAELATKYNQPVKISVIRDEGVIESEILEKGDRVMITPAGGVKGA